MQIWKLSFLSNSLYQWLVALAAGLLVYGVLRLLRWLLGRESEKPAPGHTTGAAALVRSLTRKTSQIFSLWLGIFTASRFLALNPKVETVLETLTIIITLVQVGLWSVELVDYWFTHRKAGPEGEINYKKGPASAVVLMAKLGVWVVVIILVLENIPGVHVTTLIASLGIGGIAIGLALQRILADLFASMTISIDKPFVEGDSISVDNLSGQVEHVGLKSTRIHSDTGEELIFANSDLIQSRIHNFKRLKQRPIVFTINITYQTSHKKLEKIPAMLKEIIENQPKVTFNRAHFKSYDVSALVFEVVYTVNTDDFSTYMDVQQEINLEIYRRFADAGIEFAYPTQTVWVNKE